MMTSSSLGKLQVLYQCSALETLVQIATPLDLLVIVPMSYQWEVLNPMSEFLGLAAEVQAAMEV